MLEAMARLMELLGLARPDQAYWSAMSWDEVFDEARRQFPNDRFQVEVDALAELRRRERLGFPRHDA